MYKLPMVTIVFCISILANVNALAQHPVKILQAALDEANSHRYINYSTVRINKNIFSDKDTSVTRSDEAVITNPTGQIIKQNVFRKDKKGNSLFRNVFLKDTLYTLDIKDSVYSIKAHPKNVSNALKDYVETLKYIIDKKAARINRTKDTVVNKQRCYSFFVKSYDTLENNNHNYTHIYLYINQQTLLPVYTREIAAGSADKGGYSLGWVNVFNETYFNRYRFNVTMDNNVFKLKLNGFDPENKTMLTAGELAPDINVTNMQSKAIPPTFFKNKVLLLAFGSTTCAANPLANPVLNRLMQKFNKTDVAIAGIYTQETAEQARLYMESNHLQFPVYLGNIKLKKCFKTISTPNFYIINKKGKIVEAFEGYNDKLEQELIAALERAKAEIN